MKKILISIILAVAVPLIIISAAAIYFLGWTGATAVAVIVILIITFSCGVYVGMKLDDMGLERVKTHQTHVATQTGQLMKEMRLSNRPTQPMSNQQNTIMPYQQLTDNDLYELPLVIEADQKQPPQQGPTINLM